MYAGGILPRLLAFSPREKAACMPVPEGRMRATPILSQHLIREKLVPLARDSGGPKQGLHHLNRRRVGAILPP